MNTDPATLFRSLLRIRRFEETVIDNFPKGVFFGTTHVYIGQEANAVGVLSHMDDTDIVFSNHRCHGHFLAYGGSPYELFAELMGKITGVCGGRGGSQHLNWRNFFSNGVQGGIAPIATGMALAEKLKKNQTIAIAFLGDGTLGEGVVYESINLSSLYKAPILFVVENNHIAQTTPTESALAGSIRARFEAFNVPTNEIDSSDVLEIESLAGEMIRKTRAFQSPHAFILNTNRFAPHSKGDDTRSLFEIQSMRETRDPVTIHGSRIQPGLREQIIADVEQEITSAYQKALQDPFP
jgi:TPP-dependent pyruvate/acetoin dehydrogenase alpha subunit